MIFSASPMTANAHPLQWMLCKGGPSGAIFTDVFVLEDSDRAAYAYNLTTTELMPLAEIKFSKMWITWSGWPSEKYGMMLNRYSGEMQTFLIDKDGKSNFRFTMRCEPTAARAVGVAKRKF